MKENSQIKMVIQDNGQGFDLEKTITEKRGKWGSSITL